MSIDNPELETPEQIASILDDLVNIEMPARYHNTDWAAYAIDSYCKAQASKDLLYDLDEIDNKPWRVFRQLAKIMPEYEEEYRRYEDFYAHGGGNKVMELIEAHEREQTLNETKEE